MNAHDLSILHIRIVDLAIACLDLRSDESGIEQVCAAEFVHGSDKVFEIVADDEVGTLVLEGFDRFRAAFGAGTTDHLPPALAGEIRILFGAGQAEFFLDDALG